MKLSDFTKTLTTLEIAALVIFAIYIIFPFKTPAFIAGMVNTPIGLISVVIVTIYLFFYTNPILGVVYIFVAYELLRRSALVKSRADSYLIKYTPTEEKRQSEMVKMNPRASLTLEEDVISKMAPSQVFHKDSEISTDFKPVAERISGASMFK